MEQVRLQIQLRSGKGKGFARATRRTGMVPGIIYGHQQEPVIIQFSESGLHRIYHHSGENVLINLDKGDGSNETVMIKELQTHPLNRKIIHADFMRVSLEERITTHVPVILVGTAPGIKEGGILEFLLRELRLECQVGQIPEKVEVDISSLNIGDQIRVEDINIPEGTTVHDEPVTLIVSVSHPTVIKEEETEAIEEKEMEPEVIKEKRKEEEDEKEK
jgi:large subunit ribosomal protein L25